MRKIAFILAVLYSISLAWLLAGFLETFTQRFLVFLNFLTMCFWVGEGGPVTFMAKSCQFVTFFTFWVDASRALEAEGG